LIVSSCLDLFSKSVSVLLFSSPVHLWFRWFLFYMKKVGSLETKQYTFTEDKLLELWTSCDVVGYSATRHYTAS
jgi:hypothetical protein